MLTGCGSSAKAAPQPVGHVFTIVLENKDYERTFGRDSPVPYLARDLAARGTLLTHYHGTGHRSLGNYLAMISGQAPNPDTRADCPIFRDVDPGTRGPAGQVIGSGCVYPRAVRTIAGQLEAAGLSWRGYMEDMGAEAGREPAACAHPAIGNRDRTQSASATDQYATRHNPFVYFRSIIDDRTHCRDRDVGLDRLAADLARAETTPNYAFITPDLCHDGHDEPCADGSPGGYRGIDEFLRAWVPRITASPAFRADGLLVITFDEAEDDDSGCCGERRGGGRVGALLLSRYARAGAVVHEPVNHYGYLRSVEDIFGLRHLGHAAQEGLKTFQDVGALTAPAPRPR